LHRTDFPKKTYKDGGRLEAIFASPSTIIFDRYNNLIISDTDNHCIRKIDKNGDVSTIAGRVKPGYKDGIGANARFCHPTGLSIDSNDYIFVCDTLNSSIRKISPSGNVTTVTLSALIKDPVGIAHDKDDNIYITSVASRAIYKVDKTYTVHSVVARDDLNTPITWSAPESIAVDDENIYISDLVAIKKINLDSGRGSILFKGTPALYSRNDFQGLTLDAESNVYAVRCTSDILKITPDGVCEPLLFQGNPNSGVAINKQGFIFTIVGNAIYCYEGVTVQPRKPYSRKLHETFKKIINFSTAETVKIMLTRDTVNVNKHIAMTRCPAILNLL